jgi:thiamine kinase-like enzyme
VEQYNIEKSREIASEKTFQTANHYRNANYFCDEHGEYFETMTFVDDKNRKQTTTGLSRKEAMAKTVPLMPSDKFEAEFGEDWVKTCKRKNDIEDEIYTSYYEIHKLLSAHLKEVPLEIARAVKTQIRKDIESKN